MLKDILFLSKQNTFFEEKPVIVEISIIIDKKSIKN